MWKSILGALIPTVILIALVIVVVGGAIKNEINRISEGFVIDKSFSPGSSYATGGQDGWSAHRTQARYSIKLRGEKDGKEVEYWMTCTKEEYESCKIGDYFKR